MKKLLLPCLACTLLAASPVQAASLKKPARRTPAFVADLSPTPIKHGAFCPPPSKGLCIIKKPVGMRYRVLSTGADLEDKGNYWIADFSKSKDPATGKTLLRVVGERGDVYEIEVRFPRPPAPKAKPAVKPVETKKATPPAEAPAP